MAGGWVVDASVAVKWLVPEPLTPEARLVLDAARRGLIRIHVPELWLAEIASSLWKKTRPPGAGRLDAGRAARMMDHVRSLGVTIHSHRPLVHGALALACVSGLTVYDALYASLALSREFTLVTADDRLGCAARDAGLGERAIPLADVERRLQSM